MNDAPSNRRGPKTSWLIVAIATIVLVWGLLLPQLANSSRFQQYQSEGSINRSAIFYTEIYDR